MDNRHVPNLTMGPMFCAALRKHAVKADGTQVPIDVHPMVEPVDALAQAFAKAGADMISFHPEATRHVDRTIQLINGEGCKAGLVFNPATARRARLGARQARPILVMTVNPGFGGQAFIASALRKIEAIGKHIDASSRDVEFASRSMAASRSTTFAPPPTPAATPSWPAARSSARRTIAP